MVEQKISIYHLVLTMQNRISSIKSTYRYTLFLVHSHSLH